MPISQAQHDKFIDRVMETVQKAFIRRATAAAVAYTVAAFIDIFGGCGSATAVVAVSNEIYGALQNMADIRDLMDTCGLNLSDVQDLVQECYDKILEKAEGRAEKIVDTALLKKCVHHCSKCGKVGHNKRTCGRS